DNMTHGVPMFDRDTRLAARNRQFEQMLDLPAYFFATEPTYADLIRYLARRGEYGDVNVEAFVARVTGNVDLHSATARPGPGGSVLEIRHNPLPGGGFVSIYSDITERKRAERRIHENEQRMRSILEGSPIGAAISVEDGRLLFCNSEFARQNGFSRTNFKHVDLAALFADPSERTRLFERARREGRVRNIEIARRRTNGEPWWSLYSMDPIEYEGEKALLTWHYDITEFKNREAELAAAKAELERTRSVMQTVLDNMKDGVSLYDRNLNWLFSNARYPAIMHYPDGLIRPGVNLRDIVRHLAERGEYGPVEDIAGKVEEVIGRLTVAGGTQYERRAASGKFVELNFKILPGGELLGLYRDITELKEREEALASAKESAEDARADVARTRETLQTVLDNMKDGVTLYDENLDWVFSNKAHAEIMHYPPDFIRPGLNMRAVVRFLIARGEYGPVADAEAKVEEMIARLTVPGGIHYERRAASGKHVEFNFKTLPDGALLGLYRDINELKEREEALAKAKEVAEE